MAISADVARDCNLALLSIYALTNGDRTDADLSGFRLMSLEAAVSFLGARPITDVIGAVRLAFVQLFKSNPKGPHVVRLAELLHLSWSPNDSDPMLDPDARVERALRILGAREFGEYKVERL